MRDKPVNLQASVVARLRKVARDKKADFELVLRRYAIERLLYRLSQSPHRDRFVLKGAMLFAAWAGDPFRPTRDVDLLGFGESAAPGVAKTFQDICRQAVDDDALLFDADKLQADPIRDAQEYPGVRVRLTSARVQGSHLSPSLATTATGRTRSRWAKTPIGRSWHACPVSGSSSARQGTA